MRGYRSVLCARYRNSHRRVYNFMAVFDGTDTLGSFVNQFDDAETPEPFDLRADRHGARRSPASAFLPAQRRDLTEPKRQRKI